jgi:hypothetical protein
VSPSQRKTPHSQETEENSVLSSSYLVPRNMFQSNTMNGHQACDDEENALGAGLLLSAAAATTTTTGSDKYRRIWRRSIGVGILVSIKRPPYGQESPQPSPSSIPYAPCPQEPETAVDLEQSQHVIDVIPSVVGNGEEQAADEDRNKVVQIVKEKNFNSLQKHGGLGWVASILGSNLEVIIVCFLKSIQVI